MSIKSLLLGSAAAMMAVTGANAADAVFAAEPEPMDYVKICDTYGNGFYYIPGTETCLSINGYARVEYIYQENTSNSGASVGDRAGFQYRGRLNFDARNETDWGTLRSQIRIQGNGHPVTTGRDSAGDTITAGDGVVGLDRALISLGGLRLGYSDTFMDTHHGYAWQRSDYGFSGYNQGVFLDYTFAANGFSATIGLEDTVSTGIIATGTDPIDFYTGVAYSGSWGRVAGSVHYDNSANDLAWKVSAVVSAIENVSLKAWYMADDGTTSFMFGAREWQWGADVTYTINSQLTVWAGYSDADAVDAGFFGVGAHWDPVVGLSIRPEVHFGEGDYTHLRMRVVRSF